MEPIELIKRAQSALANAHAPYSGYQVGAALLCNDGSVYPGCNVENASYGLTNCAERTALFSAVANGNTDFKAMAITASGEAVPFPCGACRQALAEFCNDRFMVYVETADGYETTTLGDLLPNCFDYKKGIDHDI